MEIPTEKRSAEQIRVELEGLDNDKLNKITSGTESVGEVPTAGTMEITLDERKIIAQEILDSRKS